MDSNQIMLLAAEFLFALIFLRGLWAYARSRDPVQRDVTMVFLAMAALFALGVVGQVSGELPRAVSPASTVLLLAQPYLTMRLANRLGPVPRWLTTAALLGYLGTAGPLVFAPRPLPGLLVLVAVTVFVSGELAAAGLFAAAARRRAGPSAARLRL
ncbi:MAG TPA: hybrid sensor histidine kinase/response regulator, partial [Pilimelia sp.]|nr:hybrid sensor histidine kinase/response regulator [Pilimelia sp.]